MMNPENLKTLLATSKSFNARRARTAKRDAERIGASAEEAVAITKAILALGGQQKKLVELEGPPGAEVPWQTKWVLKGGNVIENRRVTMAKATDREMGIVTSHIVGVAFFPIQTNAGGVAHQKHESDPDEDVVCPTHIVMNRRILQALNSLVDDNGHINELHVDMVDLCGAAENPYAGKDVRVLQERMIDLFLAFLDDPGIATVRFYIASNSVQKLLVRKKCSLLVGAAPWDCTGLLSAAAFERANSKFGIGANKHSNKWTATCHATAWLTYDQQQAASLGLELLAELPPNPLQAEEQLAALIGTFSTDQSAAYCIWAKKNPQKVLAELAAAFSRLHFGAKKCSGVDDKAVNLLALACTAQMGCLAEGANLVREQILAGAGISTSGLIRSLRRQQALPIIIAHGGVSVDAAKSFRTIADGGSCVVSDEMKARFASSVDGDAHAHEAMLDTLAAVVLRQLYGKMGAAAFAGGDFVKSIAAEITKDDLLEAVAGTSRKSIESCGPLQDAVDRLLALNPGTDFTVDYSPGAIRKAQAACHSDHAVRRGFKVVVPVVACILARNDRTPAPADSKFTTIGQVRSAKGGAAKAKKWQAATAAAAAERKPSFGSLTAAQLTFTDGLQNGADADALAQVSGRYRADSASSSMSFTKTTASVTTKLIHSPLFEVWTILDGQGGMLAAQTKDSEGMFAGTWRLMKGKGGPKLVTCTCT